MNMQCTQTTALGITAYNDILQVVHVLLGLESYGKCASNYHRTHHFSSSRNANQNILLEKNIDGLVVNRQRFLPPMFECTILCGHMSSQPQLLTLDLDQPMVEVNDYVHEIMEVPLLCHLLLQLLCKNSTCFGTIE